MEVPTTSRGSTCAASGPQIPDAAQGPRLGPPRPRVGRPVADVLWGDDLPANPERDVSVHVSRVRGLVGGERLTRGDAGYALAVDWLDVAALEELADARRRLVAGNTVAARTAAAAELALVRGPFLADDPDAEWARPTARSG